MMSFSEKEKRDEKRRVVAHYLRDKLKNATIDRWGHVKVENEYGQFRYKVCERVVRLERKVRIVDHDEWTRIKSYSLKKIYDKATKEQDRD